MIYDTRYIIEGWHYRLLILDLYLVFVENVSLARRLSAAKSQKDFLRLQKQADRYQKERTRKCANGASPRTANPLRLIRCKKHLKKVSDTTAR